MSKKTIIYIFYAFIASSTLSIAYAVLFSSQIRCVLVPISDLDQIQPNVFVEAELGKDEKNKFLKEIAQSKARLQTFFDTLLGEPIIIAGKSGSIMKRYGMQSSSPGMSHMTPFGSYIVLGPEGMNVDVISHELVHAELLARIGWLKREQEIPAWFDEGLALLLDYRYKGSKNTWLRLTDYGKKAPSLDQLTTMSEFKKYTEISPFLSYVTSSLEVGRWWQVVGKKGLDDFFGQINEGDSFANAYKAVEQKYLKGGSELKE